MRRLVRAVSFLDLHLCQSVFFFFRLKSIAASVEKSKFKKGKVLFRKSGMKVFKARADKTPKSAEHLEWDQRLFHSSIATIIFNSFANGNYKILEGLSACEGWSCFCCVHIPLYSYLHEESTVYENQFIWSMSTCYNCLAILSSEYNLKKKESQSHAMNRIIKK